MDTDTLVEHWIDDGRKLVDELLQRGFDVEAAFWLQASEDGKWYFYIVTPLVDAQGLVQAYRQLHPLVYSRPQPGWIDPLKITLIGPSSPIAQDLPDVRGRTTAYVRWEGRRLGNRSIEGAYIYPVPATTP